MIHILKSHNDDIKEAVHNISYHMNDPLIQIFETGKILV